MWQIIKRTCKSRRIDRDFSQMTRDEIIFEKGTDKLYNELNILTILQTIQKMKSTLSIIINNDEHLIT